MHTLLLLSALVAHAGLLVVRAGTLKFVDTSEYLNLLQSMQQDSLSSSAKSGRTDAAEVEGDDDVDGDDGMRSWNSPCCLPYVWQSKINLWDGVESSTFYGFFDYPGRRSATYYLEPAFTGFIQKATDCGRYVDMYAFNKTFCVHNRLNYTLAPINPICLPKLAKRMGPFQLGPSVYGRHGLVADAWSLGTQEQLTLRRRDCAPVQASVSIRGESDLGVEYFTDVKTYIEYPLVFDLPAVCCRPVTANFGLNELRQMKLVGNSILSKFGLEH